jgi:uncharacterized protein
VIQAAANQGDVNAQVNLACMYEDGISVSKDIREAMNWYGRALAQGDEMALFNLRD